MSYPSQLVAKERFMPKYLFVSMRPKQWSKNMLVFAGLLFSRDIFILSKLTHALAAFLLFCLVSSATYLINDVVDRKKDALHPKKKNRPIAAGKLAPATALFFATFFVGISLVAAFRLDVYFGLILSTYFIFTLAYSFHLKNVIILDVLIIASGFVFRAVGGTFAIQENVSSWLIICTIFFALFMALGKRRAEIISLGDEAGDVRATLAHYDQTYLDHLITISTAACLMSYALYTLDTEVVEKFDTRMLVLTIPLVIFGLFRYLYLIYHLNLGETPENAVWGDRPILICVAVYITVVSLIIYF